MPGGYSMSWVLDWRMVAGSSQCSAARSGPPGRARSMPGMDIVIGPARTTDALSRSRPVGVSERPGRSSRDPVNASALASARAGGADAADAEDRFDGRRALNASLVRDPH